MATASPCKVLEEDLICQVCHDVLLKNPHTLRCLHNYCGQCVGRLERQEHEGSSGVFCPVCRRFSSEEDIQFNYLIKNIIDGFSRLPQRSLSQLSDVPEGSVCGQCKKSSPVAFCVNCNYNLCDVCQYTHLEIKELREHKIVSAVDGSINSAATAVKTCPDHPGCPIKASCKPCRKAVCSDCVLDTHNMHQTQAIDEALQVLLPDVKTKLNKLHSKSEFVKRVCTSVDNVNEAITANLRQILAKATEDMEEKLRKIQTDLEGIKQVVFTQVSLKNGMIIKQDLDNLVSSMETLVSWGDRVVQMPPGAAQLYELQNELLIIMDDLFGQETDIKHAIDYMHSERTPLVFTSTQLPKSNLVGQVVRLNELSKDSAKFAKIGNVSPSMKIHHVEPRGATSQSKFFVDLPDDLTEVEPEVPSQQSKPCSVRDTLAKVNKLKEVLKHKNITKAEGLHPGLHTEIVSLLKKLSQGNLTQSVVGRQISLKNQDTDDLELDITEKESNNPNVKESNVDKCCSPSREKLVSEQGKNSTACQGTGINNAPVNSADLISDNSPETDIKDRYIDIEDRYIDIKDRYIDQSSLNTKTLLSDSTMNEPIHVKSCRFTENLNLDVFVSKKLTKVETIETKRKVSRFCDFKGTLWCTFIDYEYINVYSMDGELMRTLSKSKLYPKALHPIDEENMLAACQGGLFMLDGSDGQIITRIKKGSWTDVHASGNTLAALSEDKVCDGQKEASSHETQLYSKFNNVHIHSTTAPYKEVGVFSLGHRQALTLIIHDQFIFVSSGHPYHNIVKYDIHGNILAKFGKYGTKHLYFPYICMVDCNGALLVGNGIKNKLYVVAGGKLGEIEGIESIWPKDALIIGNYLFVKSDKNIHKYEF